MGVKNLTEKVNPSPQTIRIPILTYSVIKFANANMATIHKNNWNFFFFFKALKNELFLSE